MKTKSILKLLLAVLAFVAFTSSVQGQVNSKSIEGSWLGTLKVQGIELRIIFNISKDGDGYKSTMDSPDQGAKGIALGKTSFDGTKLNIDAPALAGNYVGDLVNDTTINGIWTQGGRSFTLPVVKQKTALTVNRPQEPKPPFDYVVEEVTVPNKKFGFDLSGTLTLPKGNGPFPAVVLITGSGQEDRNEEIFGHKPFLVIADFLTKKGFAVLRCDDRGFGKSKGSPVNATSYDFSTDTRASFDFLKKDKRINRKKIGLLGHSEGGLIAMMLAAENSDIAFIVSLAGPGDKGEKILFDQSKKIAKLMGISDEDITEDCEMNRIIYNIFEKENDSLKVKQMIKDSIKDYLTKKNENEIDKKVEAISQQVSPKNYNWFRYFLLSEPSKYLEKIKCPVLALNGSKDVQVISASNIPAIENSLKKGGNKDFTVIEVKDVNHLFQHCTTGLPTEYVKIEETMSVDVLNTIGDWLAKRFL